MYAQLQTAISGLMSARRQLEVVADNLANVRTPGFQPARALFAASGSTALREPGRPARPSTSFGVRVAQIWHAPHRAPLRATGNPFDMAIDGEGWFQVETAAGPRLTRAGNFTRGDGDLLVTADGLPVLGRGGGTITLPNGQLSVSADGTVKVDDAPVGQIAVVQVDESALVREGGTLWRASGPVREADPADVRIRGGHLEESGVEATEELVAMIEAQRLFEMNQRLIDVTANTVARRALELAGVR